MQFKKNVNKNVQKKPVHAGFLGSLSVNRFPNGRPGQKPKKTPFVNKRSNYI